MGKTRTREDLRKAGFKLEPLHNVNIRIPVEVWEKLEWLAQEKGLQRPDVVRMSLADAVRTVRAPKDYESRQIRASEDDWRAWQDLAKELGQPLDVLIGRTMKRLSAHVFGTGQKKESANADGGPSGLP